MPYSTSTFGGDAGRSRWKNEGLRDRWIIDFARAVRKLAPKYDLNPRPTDAFVTAHAAISSGWGRSILVRVTKNAFGIKASKVADWPGPVVFSGATEYNNGIPYSTSAVWRVYDDQAEGISDHLSIVSNPKLKYWRAGAMLRAGDLEYMAQLGRDEWYTDLPERISRRWLNAMKYINQVLANAPPEPEPKSSGAGPIILLAVLSGIAGYFVARDWG